MTKPKIEELVLHKMRSGATPAQPSGKVEKWLFHAPKIRTTVCVAADSWFEARAKAMVVLGVGPDELELMAPGPP